MLLLPAVAVIRWFVRRRCQFSLRTMLLVTTATAAVLGWWSLTRQVGIPAVLHERDPFYEQQGSALLDHDPWAVERRDRAPPPWHFVGSTRCPLPGLIVYDETSYGLRPGHGMIPERRYVLWIFGLQIPLDYWNRDRMFEPVRPQPP